jgi:glutamyl-Q tRNA(Asp) synthetase
VAKSSYVGRFAPSPTGPLHMGSLIAAVASYVDAKFNNGRWLLRIEDLDPPREVPGADQRILRSLEAHGLHWDGQPQWQSQRHQIYAAGITQLQGAGHCFYCDCSRARQTQNHGVYDGRCRLRQNVDKASAAIRVKVDGASIQFDDAIQGLQTQHLASDVGDFVIRRKDGLYAYQLAVILDDAAQGINHVVRGADLLDSTARQIHLQRLLHLSCPHYAHFPVAGNAEGQKLSKQNRAAAIDDSRPTINLRSALTFLGQPCAPSTLQQPEDILLWATAHWQRNTIAQTRLLTW